jgi:hypothetical protein
MDRIFVPSLPKQGTVWTSLNVTVLPDFLAYIKLNLTKEEQILLSEYHLQTYMLETAFKPHPHNNFDSCTLETLTHIRSHPEFWVRQRGSEQQSLKMHQPITELQHDYEAIAQECNDVEQKFENRQYCIPNSKKVENDYVYLENPYLKSAHRFNAALFTWVPQYVCQGQSEQLSMFVLDLLVSLAIKYKPRARTPLTIRHEEEKATNEKAEQEMKKFTEFLDERGVDYKCLSSLKDYYVVSNGLLLAKAFVEASNLTPPNPTPTNKEPTQFDVKKIE